MMVSGIYSGMMKPAGGDKSRAGKRKRRTGAYVPMIDRATTKRRSKRRYNA